MKDLNILIIEDNEDHLFFIKKALNHGKMRLKIIEDGEDAYQYLLNPDVQPDIVLLDQFLPNMKGFEILEKLGTKKEAYKFIFMSVDNSEDTITKALNKGCVDFVEKGAGLGNQLTKIIAKLCEKQ